MASISKRETKSGVSYLARIRLKGYPPQTATFLRLTDARKWVQDTESAIRNGRHFNTTEAKKHTVADLVDRYAEENQLTKSDKQYKHFYRVFWWKERIGSTLLSDLSPALIAECRDELLRQPNGRGGTMAPATVVKHLTVLSRMLSIAVNEWQWLEDSPMRKVRKPAQPRGRVRFLDDAERERLLKACKESASSMLYPIVILAISTGMRQGEILNLQWRDVDLHQGFAILHETKNGERRRVPITGHALEVMREFAKVRRLDSDLIFPGNTGKPAEIRKPWLKALSDAEISDFRFHDLRHSAASYLAMNGASPAEIAEVLGHKTLQMVQRYAHLSDGHVSSVVARMNQKIFGGTGG